MEKSTSRYRGSWEKINPFSPLSEVEGVKSVTCTCACVGLRCPSVRHFNGIRRPCAPCRRDMYHLALGECEPWCTISCPTYVGNPLSAFAKKLRVPGGVQHGVWTHLHSFLIIRESIDITMLKIVKATNGGQHEMRKLAFRPPLVALNLPFYSPLYLLTSNPCILIGLQVWYMRPCTTPLGHFARSWRMQLDKV